MAIFIPRGGSFTWGCSGLMRWSSPVERRHELGTRVALSSLFPGPDRNHWIQAFLTPTDPRRGLCSFSTQFGGDFEFNLEVRSDSYGVSSVHSYRIIVVINDVEYSSVPHSTPSGLVFVSRFKMILLGVPPHASIRFSVVNDMENIGIFGIFVRPVFSNQVGLLIPHAFHEIHSLSNLNLQEVVSQVVDVNSDQTPPIRVISPSRVERVPH